MTHAEPLTRDDIKSRIMTPYLSLSSVASAVLLLSMLPFGWEALWPMVAVAIGGVYATTSLIIVRTRPQWLDFVLASYLFQVSGLLVILDFAIPGHHAISPMAALIALPAVAALLLGERWALAILTTVLVGAFSTLLYTPQVLERFIDCVAITMIAAIVGGLAAVSERMRKRAQAEAQNKQVELELTARKAMTAAAAKGTFVANMSHEIRTPMNAVLGLTRALLDSQLDRDQRELASTVLDAGESLLRVLNDVLDLSRLDAGEVHLERVPVQVRAVFTDVHNLLRHTASDRDVELITHVDDCVPDWIVGDPTRIRQVLINLVGNGMKFTAVGSVQLRATADDGGLVLSVIDTGIGISEAKRASLFEPFVQADASTTRRFGGTGLGLAICREIVLAMHGEIDVASAPGEGCTFTVRLPMETAEAPSREDSLVPIPRHGARVLVVDDNPVNLLVARRALEKLSLGVKTAKNGEDAVLLVKSEVFDLVLMDCYMPTMDGFEATRAIRALNTASAQVPIVALTASVTAEDRERVLAAGMHDLIGKPLDPAVFQRVLAEHLGEHRVAC